MVLLMSSPLSPRSSCLRSSRPAGWALVEALRLIRAVKSVHVVCSIRRPAFSLLPLPYARPAKLDCPPYLSHRRVVPTRASWPGERPSAKQRMPLLGAPWHVNAITEAMHALIPLTPCFLNFILLNYLPACTLNSVYPIFTMWFSVRVP